LSESRTRALKRTPARDSALAAEEPTRPVAPVNKIMLSPVAVNVFFASLRLICVAVVRISKVASHNVARATIASQRYARLGP